MRIKFTMLRPDLQSLMDQFVKFRIQYSALESKCRDMEEDHRLDIVDIHRTNADQIMRMEEEIEILRSQLAAMEEVHREEIHNIEKRYEKEKLNFETTIGTLKSKIDELRMALEKNVEFNSHPAFHMSTPANRNRQKKPATSNFKWPTLEVNTSKTSTFKSKDRNGANLKKRRKLYSNDDDDSIVDIISYK